MNAPLSRSAMLLERLSRAATYLAFFLAFLSAVAAPLLALSWGNQPFPGFLVEPTLVLTGQDDWSVRPQGLDYPQRVVRIGNSPVSSTAELGVVLSSHSVGDTVSLLTRSPDGATRLYPSITLERFAAGDMLRLFWMPYLVGLLYLGLGVWIYYARGRSRPGRALAFFCVSVAVASLLLFDLDTTHALSPLWTLAVSLAGGALISLGLRFPEEWRAVERRAWLLALPYMLSFGLGLWGIGALRSAARPWAYLSAWGASYRYDALAILVFLGIMLYRARKSDSVVVKSQARLMLVGGGLGFIPMGLWLVAPLFKLAMPFNGLFLLPGLMLFPLSVVVALFRYRLPETDHLVSRTLAYGVLTALVAGLLPAVIGLSQRLFVAFTGERSDTAIVITTLIVAAAWTPMRAWLDRLINAYLKEEPDNARALKQFGDQVRTFTLLSDPEQLLKRLLDEAVSALHALSGVVSLVVDGRMQIVHSTGRWTGEAWLSLPLESRGMRYAMLFLGPSQDGRPYSREDFAALRLVAFDIARAIGQDTACRPVAVSPGEGVVSLVPEQSSGALRRGD